MPAAAPPRRPAVARKKAKNFRLSEQSLNLLEELERTLGDTQTGIVEEALRHFYLKTTGRKKLPDFPPRNKPEGS
jgi:hypothetical protein